MNHFFLFQCGDRVRLDPAGSGRAILEWHSGQFDILSTLCDYSSMEITFEAFIQAGGVVRRVQCVHMTEFNGFSDWWKQNVTVVKSAPAPHAAPMKRTVFGLTQGAEAFIAPNDTRVFVKPKSGPTYTIKSVTAEDIITSTQAQKFRFRFEGTNRVLHVVLDQPVASEFVNWLYGNGVSVSSYIPGPQWTPSHVEQARATHTRRTGRPTTGQPHEEGCPDPTDGSHVTCPECPECWGTGHFKGYGGPCSRGCRK